MHHANVLININNNSFSTCHWNNVTSLWRNLGQRYVAGLSVEDPSRQKFQLYLQKEKHRKQEPVDFQGRLTALTDRIQSLILDVSLLSHRCGGKWTLPVSSLIAIVSILMLSTTLKSLTKLKTTSVFKSIHTFWSHLSIHSSSASLIIALKHVRCLGFSHLSNYSWVVVLVFLSSSLLTFQTKPCHCLFSIC